MSLRVMAQLPRHLGVLGAERPRGARERDGIAAAIRRHLHFRRDDTERCRAAGDPLPAPQYFAAVAILAVGVGITAAVLPAVAAARRDPLTELRVP